MNEPITIIEAAREAAHKEQLFRSDQIRGHYVQLAINAATEQLRAELESVKLELKTAHEQLFRAGDEPLAALGCAAENEARLRADLAALRQKWESDEPGTPGLILRACASVVSEAMNCAGSSRPISAFARDLVAERDQLRTDLVAMTKERDAERLSAERWKAAAQINDSNHQLVIATLQSDLAAMTKERDEAKELYTISFGTCMMHEMNPEEMVSCIRELKSDLAASQRTLVALRPLVALLECKCDEPSYGNYTCPRCATLSSTFWPAPALVSRDTERLDYALLHSEWLYKTFCSSTWPFEETKTQLRAAIDAELAAVTKDRDDLQRSIQDLSHPNCRMILKERDAALAALKT